MAEALNTGSGSAYANESVMRSRFHMTPAFLRIAAACLGMCCSKREAHAAAARLRLCATLDAAILELFAALEAEAPLAIEALCLLRVSAVGLHVSVRVVVGSCVTPLTLPRPGPAVRAPQSAPPARPRTPERHPGAGGLAGRAQL